MLYMGINGVCRICAESSFGSLFHSVLAFPQFSPQTGYCCQIVYSETQHRPFFPQSPPSLLFYSSFIKSASLLQEIYQN